MYKLLRHISDNFILIFTLTIITLFVSLGTSFIKEYGQNVYEQDYYMGKNCVGFNVENFKETSYKQLLGEIIGNGNYNVFNIRMMGGDFAAQGIYLKEDLKVIPELIEGRFFDKNDFNNYNNKIAVIGKGLLDRTTQKGEFRYITFNNEEYKIIGIMGNEKKQKMFDYTMIFNLLNLTDNENYMKITDGWYISNYDSNQNLSDIINSINNKLHQWNKIISLSEMEAKIQPNPTLTAINNNKNMIYYFAILVGAIALNILIIVHQWIGELEKNIGIRKAFGAKPYQIYLFVFKNYIKNSIIASLLGLLIQIFLLKIKLFNINEDITVTNFIVITVFAFIFSSFLLGISVRKLNKLQPNYIMKGC